MKILLQFMGFESRQPFRVCSTKVKTHVQLRSRVKGTLHDLYSKSLLYATTRDAEVGEERAATLRRKIDMHEIRRVSRHTQKNIPPTFRPSITRLSSVVSRKTLFASSWSEN